MPGHAALAVQGMVYQLLKSDAQILSLLGGEYIYDHVPDNTATPYITFGEDSFDDFGAHEVDGFQGFIEIHTWTQAEGGKLCKQIQDIVYRLFHNSDLGLTEHKTISLRGGLFTTMLDPDGRTFHGVNRFNLILGG